MQTTFDSGLLRSKTFPPMLADILAREAQIEVPVRTLRLETESLKSFLFDCGQNRLVKLPTTPPPSMQGKILAAFESEIAIVATSSDLFAVQTPRCLAKGQDVAFFVMEKLTGAPLWKCQRSFDALRYSDKPVFSDSEIHKLAMFHTAFDQHITRLAPQEVGRIPTPTEEQPCFPFRDFGLRAAFQQAQRIITLEKATARFLHNDLTPSNILRSPKGDLQIVDFGNVVRGDPHQELATMAVDFGPTVVRKLVKEINQLDPSWALDFRQVVLASFINIARRFPRHPSSTDEKHIKARIAQLSAALA